MQPGEYAVIEFGTEQTLQVWDFGVGVAK